MWVELKQRKERRKGAKWVKPREVVMVSIRCGLWAFAELWELGNREE